MEREEGGNAARLSLFVLLSLCSRPRAGLAAVYEKDKDSKLRIDSRSLSQQDARMGSHVYIIVGYVFGIPISLFWKPHRMIRLFFVLNPTSTNLTLLHVKPVNVAAGRVSSLRLSLIIALPESVNFKRGELAVS